MLRSSLTRVKIENDPGVSKNQRFWKWSLHNIKKIIILYENKDVQVVTVLKFHMSQEIIIHW